MTTAVTLAAATAAFAAVDADAARTAYDRGEAAFASVYAANAAYVAALRAVGGAAAAGGAGLEEVGAAMASAGATHRPSLVAALAALVEAGRIDAARALEVVADPAAWVCYGEVCIESPDDGVGYSLWGAPVYW